MLQIRTHVLDDDWEATFREWCHRFRAQAKRRASLPPEI
jgi:hypothetical protein